MDKEKRIKELLEKGILIGGVISRSDDGFVTFDRINDVDELLQKEKDGYEIGFATKTMGRAIFVINQNGEIENYKGVDSQLGDKENSLTQQTSTNTFKIDNPENDSHHQIVLKSSPKKKGERSYEVRFMGTSPLEDLEIEADINSKMSKFGIKVPKILAVKEYPKELSKKLGLPTFVEGCYEELRKKASYANLDQTRKNNLRNIDIDYYDTMPEGERPELLIEYFERYGLLDDPRFNEFIDKERKIVNNDSISIIDFIEHVDEDYALGQRHGQAVRIVGSPFRISDIEKFISDKDIDALNSIMQFTKETIPECNNPSPVSVEDLFAKRMGKNIALLMNNGWMMENMSHRQDYNLAGEMCDDSYFDINERIKSLNLETDIGKREASIEELRKLFLGQIHYMSSNIKVLQDEMQLRGIPEEDITNVIDSYTKSYIDTLDVEMVANSTGLSKEEVFKSFLKYFDTSKVPYEYNLTNPPENYTVDQENRRDYVLELAEQKRGEKGVFYHEAIFLSSKGNQEFYRDISERCLSYFKEKYQIFDRDILSPTDNSIKSSLKKIASSSTARDVRSNQSEIRNNYNELENPEQQKNGQKNFED